MAIDKSKPQLTSAESGHQEGTPKSTRLLPIRRSQQPTRPNPMRTQKGERINKAFK
jgi:hypothetical protein